MWDIHEVIAVACEAALAATQNYSVQILLDVPQGIELPLIRPRVQSVFEATAADRRWEVPGETFP
jgi:hypothetical protein